MWLSLTAPVLICMLWSATIEMVQLFVPTRDTARPGFIDEYHWRHSRRCPRRSYWRQRPCVATLAHDIPAITQATEGGGWLGGRAVVLLVELALVSDVPRSGAHGAVSQSRTFSARAIGAASAVPLRNAGLGSCRKSSAGGWLAPGDGDGSPISIVLIRYSYSSWIASQSPQLSREPLPALSVSLSCGHCAKLTAAFTGKSRRGHFSQRSYFAACPLSLLGGRPSV